MDLLSFVLAGLFAIFFGGLVKISPWLALAGVVVFCVPLVFFGIRQRQLSATRHSIDENTELLQRAHQSSADNLQRAIHDDSSASGH